MPNPVHIYVLHHPESTLGAELTDRIYDWFRLPSLDGIPVYVRSVAAGEDGRPLDPAAGSTSVGALEYLIPLVDAYMVRDPLWHDYLVALAEGCRHGATRGPRTAGWVMFPVGLDASAFNLPKLVTETNFIRHGVSPAEPPIPAADQANLDAEETLKHLTEALARDLNGRLFPQQAAARFKVFISYSRADSTPIAKSLRDYIQGETQCQVFLDENDIAYGRNFEESLQANVSDLARAMIVINGDNYADRPWCRWEIGRFTTPRVVPLAARGSAATERGIHIFQPILVVDSIKGPKMTRVLPELAQAPLVRWEAGRAKLCFSVLMREVLLGLKEVLVARQALAGEDLSDAIVVNRLPGPVAIERLLREQPPVAPPGMITIHHPGHGLPLIELRLLKHTFKGVRFRAFRDVMRDGGQTMGKGAAPATKMHAELEGLESADDAGFPLRGKVIAVSSAHSTRELAALGYLPQHQDEALMHLLRPLFRMGADVLYGGLPPFEGARGIELSWSAKRNITTSLLRLQAEERREDTEDIGTGGGAIPARRPLIFNVPPWPANRDITASDEAGWMNACRILRVGPEEAGLPPWTGDFPKGKDEPPPGFRRYVALVLSEMRRRHEGEYRCRLPGDGERVIRPAAFVLIGGKLADFAGVAPGIMEEFLHASRTGRPIYLIGGLRGAAGAIADALCAPKGSPRPPEFTMAHYLAQKRVRALTDYPALIKELEAAGDPSPQEIFDALWEVIEKHRGGALAELFGNGLSAEQNRRLLKTTNTNEAVSLAWEGIGNVPGMLSPAEKPPAPKPIKPGAGARKPRRARKPRG